jgi:RNA ligase (TIGR02306 family)
MRKLATIRRIDSINPIEGADAIEVATVGGWKVVVKKNEFAAGHLAVYLEIDSWVPTELAAFLSKGKEPREFEGIRGERLKTIRLRGQLSQGLLLPIDVLAVKTDSGNYLGDWEQFEGHDVTERLGIVKWERPMNAQLAGMARGNFPSLIPKTDQERVQNLGRALQDAELLTFEVTEKMEGSSMTCYLIDGVFGVCSRNLDLKETEGNTFWAVARAEDIEGKMRAMFMRPESGTFNDVAVQGELIGPGIQDNIYQLTQHQFRVFDIYDINDGKYVLPDLRREVVEKMGLRHVPVLNANKQLNSAGVDTILAWADGASELNAAHLREGLVFKEVNGGMTFKAISNSYLLGEKPDLA